MTATQLYTTYYPDLLRHEAVTYNNAGIADIIFAVVLCPAIQCHVPFPFVYNAGINHGLYLEVSPMIRIYPRAQRSRGWKRHGWNAIKENTNTVTLLLKGLTRSKSTRNIKGKD